MITLVDFESGGCFRLRWGYPPSNTFWNTFLCYLVDGFEVGNFDYAAPFLTMRTQISDIIASRSLRVDCELFRMDPRACFDLLESKLFGDGQNASDPREKSWQDAQKYGPFRACPRYQNFDHAMVYLVEYEGQARLLFEHRGKFDHRTMEADRFYAPLQAFIDQKEIEVPIRPPQ